MMPLLERRLSDLILINLSMLHAATESSPELDFALQCKRASANDEEERVMYWGFGGEQVALST